MLRPNSQSGAVALEALLSIIIMFVAIYAIWAVSVFIYNQSQITTASQFASHTAVNTMVTNDPYLGDDNHAAVSQTNVSFENGPFRPVYGPRGSNPTTFCLQVSIYWRAQCISKKQADFIFDDNTLSLLPDQFTGAPPSIVGNNELTITCNTNSKPYNDENWSQEKCRGGEVTGVRTVLNTPKSQSYLSFLDFSTFGRSGQSVAQDANSTATRYLLGRRRP